MLTLAAVLLPALAMPILMWFAPHAWPLPDLSAPRDWPVEFWFIAIAGSVATVGGMLDWRFHRAGGRRISRQEHRAELAALSCGVPLFAMLATASIVERPLPWLVPIVSCSLVMAVLIAFDEARFHRGCGRYETALHRLLVGGHTIAFLAWLSWAFTRGDTHG